MNPSLMKNAFLKICLTVCSLLIPLLIGPYLARVFDTGLYGDYNRALAQLSAVMPIASFGIYTYGVRMVSRVRDRPRQAASLFSRLFRIGAFTNLLGFGAFLLYSLCFAESSSFALYFALSLQILDNIFVSEWMNEAFENYGFITVKTILVRLLYAALVILLVKKPDDVVLFALLVAFASFLNNFSSFLVAWAKCRKYKRLPDNGPPLQPVKSVWKPLLLLTLITNAGILFTQLDKLFLSYFCESIQSTYYAMPQNIVITIMNIANSIVLVAVPRLSYLLSRGKTADYRALLSKTAQTFCMAVFPIGIGIAVTARFIMALYGGADYAAAAPTLFLFGMRAILQCFTIIMVHQIIYLHGREKALVRCMLVCGLVNLGANALLAWLGRVTPETLLFTTMLSECLLVFLERCLVWRIDPKIRLFLPRTLKYLLVALLFFPVSAGINAARLGSYQTGALTVAVCAALYFGLLLVTRDRLLLGYLRDLRFRIACRLHR